ncbi:Katanin p80 WD40 repeat-containing subunit B1 homolog KTN80.2-like protein [Drosera capensis]
MAKNQEFVAHSGSVNCVRIGKKTHRYLLSGGDDQKVNLWPVGKPNSLMSLRGHNSPVECVAYDSSEVLVLGGAASGAIKLWNIEEEKLVRSLTGHRSNCAATEFHPFGEFVASGSVDSDLKIWDIRKKGCIQTYKGHSLGISAVKFTPDGRWVVSGGFDNVVKVWDLTAGKLLHDFKFHEGHIRSIDFHPLEFLLATGSADRTVKFCDLETFEMIGSARAEATGVRAMAFHPDGRTLFCGYDDTLKVYSWEPVICHDTVDMRWSTLSDLCIHEEKLIGCSYHRNSIGLWVADLSLIQPYGADDVNVPVDDCPVELKHGLHDSHLKGEVETAARSAIGPHEKPINFGKQDSTDVIPPSDLKNSSKLPSNSRKQSPAVSTRIKPNMPSRVKSFAISNILSRENPERKDAASLTRESLGPLRADSGMTFRSAHLRRSSSSNSHSERNPLPESRSFSNLADPKFIEEAVVKELFEDKHPTGRTVHPKSETDVPTHVRSYHNSGPSGENLPDLKETRAVKFVDGVKVVHGRTRSLVEKFERREHSLAIEEEMEAPSQEGIVESMESSVLLKEEPEISGREEKSTNDASIIEGLMQSHDILLSGLRSRLTKLQVVRHFWERNDVKGSIDAMKRLPDPSVQADVISVLAEKMEIVTLDLHATMSLEMLLKLVAVFGPTICSTISGPRGVGVDLHQEQRIESYKQCFNQLKEVQKVLPTLVRRGGLLAKSAQELNLILLHHNIQ